MALSDGFYSGSRHLWKIAYSIASETRAELTSWWAPNNPKALLGKHRLCSAVCAMPHCLAAGVIGSISETPPRPRRVRK